MKEGEGEGDNKDAEIDLNLKVDPDVPMDYIEHKFEADNPAFYVDNISLQANSPQSASMPIASIAVRNKPRSRVTLFPSDQADEKTAALFEWLEGDDQQNV